MVLELKRAFSDGTTHVLFEQPDFIARLAALVPRPKAVSKVTANDECEPNVGTTVLGWMARLKRVFAIDLKHGPHYRDSGYKKKGKAKYFITSISCNKDLLGYCGDHATPFNNPF